MSKNEQLQAEYKRLSKSIAGTHLIEAAKSVSDQERRMAGKEDDPFLMVRRHGKAEGVEWCIEQIHMMSNLDAIKKGGKRR